MPESLKDMLNQKTLHEFALIIKAAYEPFDIYNFIKSTIDETWNNLELKARGRQVTINMGKFLPQDYKTALSICDKAAINTSSFYSLTFPDYIEVFGQDEEHFALSMEALARYTVYGSAEFAVRPFIINRQERMMAQMYAWSKHENEHVRRLSSEGCRPALPWGQALNSFKKDPTPILPILEQLKTDPSLYVRKSVANNINDISKTHPDLITELAKKWHGQNPHTDWIIKHGCRTLLKKGNKDALSIFGITNDTPIDVHGFAISTPSVKIGEDLAFSFTIEAQADTKVRLEYAIDFVKANKKVSEKVFQISEAALKAGKQKSYNKTHSFANLSTRKHYPGTHSITLIINGIPRATLDFDVNHP